MWRVDTLKGVMRMRWLVISAMVALWGVAAYADPSFLGYTGLFFAPTADTIPARRFNASWWVDTEFVETSSTYSVAYGLIDQAEVSFVRLPGGVAGVTTSLVNLKLRITEPVFGKQVKVAAGLIDIADESKNLTFLGRVNGGTRGYLVASGVLWEPKKKKEQDIQLVRGHLGFAGGRGRNNLFIGLEAQLMEPLTLIGEVFDNDYNVGARLQVTKRISLDGFVVNLREPDVVVGISYNQRW